MKKYNRSLRLWALALATCSALVLSGCTDAPTAERVLRQNGYTEIETTGYRAFMGGKEDTYVTGFRAKSPSGQIVTGAVCSGWMKGATIRFD